MNRPFNKGSYESPEHPIVGVENGGADIAGFGRNSFAYPDFPRDIIKKGMLEKNKCCITCSKCTELMRAGKPSGCVIRDTGVYLPIYQT